MRTCECQLCTPTSDALSRSALGEFARAVPSGRRTCNFLNGRRGCWWAALVPRAAASLRILVPMRSATNWDCAPARSAFASERLHITPDGHASAQTTRSPSARGAIAPESPTLPRQRALRVNWRGGKLLCRSFCHRGSTACRSPFPTTPRTSRHASACQHGG